MHEPCLCAAADRTAWRRTVLGECVRRARTSAPRSPPHRSMVSSALACRPELVEGPRPQPHPAEVPSTMLCHPAPPSPFILNPLPLVILRPEPKDLGPASVLQGPSAHPLPSPPRNQPCRPERRRRISFSATGSRRFPPDPHSRVSSRAQSRDLGVSGWVRSREPRVVRCGHRSVVLRQDEISRHASNPIRLMLCGMRTGWAGGCHQVQGWAEILHLRAQDDTGRWMALLALSAGGRDPSTSLRIASWRRWAIARPAKRS